MLIIDLDHDVAAKEKEEKGVRNRFLVTERCQDPFPPRALYRSHLFSLPSYRAPRPRKNYLSLSYEATIVYMKGLAYAIRGFLSLLMMLFGAFMTLIGGMGLYYGEFHGRAYSIFNLAIGIAIAIGGWKLFPVEK